MLVVFELECSLFNLEHSKYMVKSFFVSMKTAWNGASNKRVVVVVARVIL